MRRSLFVIALAAVAIGGLLATPRTSRADEGWVINSFDIVYDVQDNGTIEATETIKADFGSLSKHGIFRYFNTKVPCGTPIAGAQQPLTPCPKGEFRQYTYNIDSVTKADGSKWKYDVSDSSGKVTVKIGDGDILLSGRQDYIIKYQLSGAFDAYDDHDELYWDVSGTWPVTIKSFSLTLNLPKGADSRALCYEGYSGSNEECEATANGSTITYASGRPLSENEQVTIVAGWQSGLFDFPPPVLADRTTFRDFFTFDAPEFAGLSEAELLACFS